MVTLRGAKFDLTLEQNIARSSDVKIATADSQKPKPTQNKYKFSNDGGRTQKRILQKGIVVSSTRVCADFVERANCFGSIFKVECGEDAWLNDFLHVHFKEDGGQRIDKMAGEFFTTAREQVLGAR